MFYGIFRLYISCSRVFFIIKIAQILKKEFALLLVAEAGLEHATSRL